MPSSVGEASELNTQILLERARHGSQAAWSAFYKRYKAFLMWNVQVNMPDAAQRQFDPEDVLQSAFLAAWSNLVNFEYRGEGSFRRYMRRIVLNRFLNKLKHLDAQGKIVSVDEELLGEADGPTGRPRGEDPADILSREDFLRHSMTKVRELPEEDQELIGMRFYEGLNWSQIGDIVGCDRETANARFLRALKRLERLIGPDA